MGGESKSTTTQSSTTAPWEAAQPALSGILGQLQGNLNNTGTTGQETGAINSIEANAANAPNNSGAINGYVTSLLGGGGANAQAPQIQSGLSTYQNQLTPYANGSMVGNNPALQAQLQQIQSDVTNSVNGQFAGAGRDFSGANQMALGRGIAAGEAPVIANQYNQDVSNQLNAAGQLYGAQNQTSGLLSGLQQQYLGNQGTGMQAAAAAPQAQNAASNSILQAEAARRGIPVQALGLLAQIGIPIAGLGAQSTGQAQGTQQASLAQQIGQIGSGLGGIFSNFGVGKAFPKIF